MVCSVLTLAIGSCQGMGDVEYGKIYDFYVPLLFMFLLDGPNVNIREMWCSPGIRSLTHVICGWYIYQCVTWFAAQTIR